MTFSLKSNFELSDKRVLLIGSHKTVLYQYRGGRLSNAYVFSVDEAGYDNFSRYLAGTSKSPVHVLVDIVEEEYRQDAIPHVFGSDRQSVLERKYARLFRGTDYRHALAQGREKGGRRDDSVLLTALTKPDVVAGWIHNLRENKIPVAGMYSLPILSQLFLKHISARGPNVLLVSVQNASGLRQTFFRDRQIKISRLAPMPRLGSVPYASHLLGELEKVRRYLNSLALISPDGPLEVYILSHGKLLNQLEQACSDSDDQKYYLIDTADVSKRLGISQATSTPYSDAIFAQLLLDTAPKNHYATNAETQYFRLDRARRGLLAASVLLLLAGIGWSGFNFIEGVSLKQQALDAAEKASFYQTRYEIAHKHLPVTSVEPTAIQLAVDIVSTLNQHKSSPLDVLTAIGGAVDQSPGVELDQVEWFTSTDPNATDPDKIRKTASADRVEIPRDKQYSHYHIATLRGHMKSFSGDYRQAIGNVDSLAEKLAGRANMRHVEVAEYPLNIDSDASLSGTATEHTQEPAARFTIKFVLGISDGSGQS